MARGREGEHEAVGDGIQPGFHLHFLALPWGMSHSRGPGGSTLALSQLLFCAEGFVFILVSLFCRGAPGAQGQRKVIHFLHSPSALSSPVGC